MSEIEIQDILTRTSIEVIVETPADAAQLHADMRTLAQAYCLDLRYAAISLVRDTPEAYPKICSVWDADRPIGFRDLIFATSLLYMEGVPERSAAQTPENASNATGAT